MSKKKLIEQFAETRNIAKSAAKPQVEAVFEAISHLLAQGEEVVWPGFGGFRVVHKPARIGKNPKTGEVISIAEKAVPHFKPALSLKQLIQAQGKGKPTA